MEMGFVGMEISTAYQFLRYGYLTGNNEAVSYGEAMADMRAENSGLPSGVLKTYLRSNGVFDSMPCYLRRMTDGMEGMLDCCRIAMSNGKEYKAWLSLAEKMQISLSAVRIPTEAGTAPAITAARCSVTKA